MRPLSSVFLLLLLLLSPARAVETLDLAPLKKWIARQDEFRSVQADFTQTRALRALRLPVAIPGRLIFATPSSLRWEMGDPAKNIVLRNGDTYWLIQPGKKKAQRIAADKMGGASEMKGLAMMEFPLASDFADFQRKFEVQDLKVEGQNCHVELLPRDAQVKKFLSTMKIDFDVKNGHMRAFEVVTREGSSMRNEFTNVRMNEKIDRRVFDYDLTGFEVTEEKK